MEIWKDVTGFEGRFRISNHGKLLSINGKFLGEKLLNPATDGAGYYNVTLRNKPDKRYTRVHVLVAEHFIDIPDSLIDHPQRCVNHKDGNKLNNHVSNLEWTTLSGNFLHAHETGLTNNRGENSGNAKLTEADVLKIRELYKTKTALEISALYNVERRHINDVVNGINWKHLPIPDYSNRNIIRKERKDKGARRNLISV